MIEIMGHPAEVRRAHKAGYPSVWDKKKNMDEIDRLRRLLDEGAQVTREQTEADKALELAWIEVDALECLLVGYISRKNGLVAGRAKIDEQLNRTTEACRDAPTSPLLDRLDAYVTRLRRVLVEP